MPPETNILIFEVVGSYSAQSLKNAFEKEGILVMDISPTQIRIVLHLDITKKMVQKTLEVIGNL